MRSYPTKEDADEVEMLHAEEWQLNLLKLNPEYVYWGNHEDYMSDSKAQWNSPVTLKSWSEHWKLDDLNELVNFYFEVHRKNHECEHCKGSALNPATQQLSEDWYDFANTGRKWSYAITDVEVDALMKGGRLRDVTSFVGYYDEERKTWVKWDGKAQVDCEKPEYPTAKQVNTWASGRGFGHDAINQWICVRARAEHLGIYGHCDHCNGQGVIYDEPNAKVSLQLWMLHPRKGCSKGVLIENIQEEELPEVFDYLKEAANRNKDRFSQVVKMANRAKKTA